VTGLLASVASREEAIQAVAWGADIVDLKDPSRGALGAWKPNDLALAVEQLAGEVTLSATTGDLPMRPGLLAEAAAATAAAGVALVKVGFFAGGDVAACIAALEPLARRGVRLVAVLMADQAPELRLVPALARAGFAGVMLDTADKAAGGLRAHQDPRALAGFVAAARASGLLSGLAGSLTLQDIEPLLSLRPDYLGFRTALCRGDRTAALDAEAFARVRAALPRVAGADRPTGRPVRAEQIA
jgi:uncharacterized protein (UPF0264 family)